MFAQYTNGVITGLFANPQPDAVDDKGQVVCAGVKTIQIPDDHPDVLAFNAPKPAVVSEELVLTTALAAKVGITSADLAAARVSLSDIAVDQAAKPAKLGP